MPPLLRQVFDRHINDFKRGLLDLTLGRLKQWFGKQNTRQGYVFEPQRKAAIAHFRLQQTPQTHPDQCQLTVHPAYTWLYPELLAKIAQFFSETENPQLLLASADYQPEREEYLEEIGAERVEHTLLLSRSVWHKLREAPSSLERLQLSGVLQGLRPGRAPIPSRLPWLNSFSYDTQEDQRDQPERSLSEEEEVEDN
jgi:hypothetical protein